MDLKVKYETNRGWGWELKKTKLNFLKQNHKLKNPSQRKAFCHGLYGRF